MATAVAPARRTRSQTKLVLFVIFGLLTAFVIYMKNARIFDPTSPIARHFAPAMFYLIPHAFFGVLALTLGAFQFSNRLRARYLKVHRILGYIYVVSVFVAAPFAIPVAMRTASFSLTAASVAQALLSILQNNKVGSTRLNMDDARSFINKKVAEYENRLREALIVGKEAVLAKLA